MGTHLPTADYGCARVLVVGLDSATFDVMTPLLEAGWLPNLKRLMDMGASAVLKSTVPPLSPAAWVSTITGRNPGAHGVFDFRHLDLSQFHGRKQTLVSSAEYAGQTIFDLLSQNGLRVGAFNIPLTYPAWPINGVMISGPITPDPSRAYTHPPELADQLGPMTALTDQADSYDPDEVVLMELIETSQLHFRLGVQLLEREGPFDLFWFHLHSLDSGQHRFWRYVDPALRANGSTKQIRLSHAIQELYRLADAGVGDLLHRMGPESLVCIISDHGSRPRPGVSVRLNVWLREQGWLALWERQRDSGLLSALYRAARSLLPMNWRQRMKGQLPETVQDRITHLTAHGVCWSHTVAYYFPLTNPVGGIVINLAGRQPQGIVDPGDYERVRRQIAERLRGLRDPRTGQKIMREVWYREELYAGPFVERAPDILFMLESPYETTASLAEPWLASAASSDSGKQWSGVHTMDGILIAAGPQIRPGRWADEARLLDVMPTLLYALGQPIPSNVDGRVLQRLFTPDFNKTQAVSFFEAQAGTHNEMPTASDEETEAMMAHLRALGYIE